MPFYIFVIIFSFIASMFGMKVKENRIPPLTFFPFFLLLTAVVEFSGWYLSFHYTTTLLYNLFSLFEFIFYLFFFRYLFQSGKVKKTILIVIVLYFIVTTLNIFFFQGRKNFHTYTYMLGCILILACSISYFYFLFRFPETGTLAKNPYFWIVTGLMFFDTCSFTLIGLNNFITETMVQYNWVLFIVSDVLNVLLYSLFSIAFLCKVNIRKLSGLS